MARTKTTTDKRTLELIQLVKAKKDEIAQLERPQYKTNCSFSCVESRDLFNIHTESDVMRLISCAARLIEMELSYKRTADLLGVESVPDFAWNGYPVEEWVDDLRTRISKVQIAAKRKKLEVLEDRLNKIVSPELRAQLELESIEGELS